jgi:hypothetical protein
MGQEQNVWREETNLEREKTLGRKKDESATGRDIPGGDGNVGDEQLDAIGKKHRKAKEGQDHSTEHHEINDPAGGVGAIQDASDTTSDIADIKE